MPRTMLFYESVKPTAIKTETIVLLGLGGAALLYAVGSKAVAASNLTFYPGAVTSMSLAGSTPVMTFTMQVENTSSTGLTINSLSGNAFANGTLVGNVYNFSPVIVPPNSMALIPVTAQLNTIGLVNDMIRAFQYGNFSQTIKVNLVANVQGLQIPVELNLSIGN